LDAAFGDEPALKRETSPIVPNFTLYRSTCC
jgi:hypothetical protein